MFEKYGVRRIRGCSLKKKVSKQRARNTLHDRAIKQSQRQNCTDLMRIHDRREAVRDENHRAVSGGDQSVQRALHGRLGLGVQRLCQKRARAERERERVRQREQREDSKDRDICIHEYKERGKSVSCTRQVQVCTIAQKKNHIFTRQASARITQRRHTQSALHTHARTHRRGLVEKQNRRATQNRARNADTLLLSTGKSHGALTDTRLVTLIKGPDETWQTSNANCGNKRQK